MEIVSAPNLQENLDHSIMISDLAVIFCEKKPEQYKFILCSVKLFHGFIGIQIRNNSAKCQFLKTYSKIVFGITTDMQDLTLL